MNLELISISNSLKELKISISKEEFNDVYVQKLKGIQGTIKMPGFRPGRVPVKLIESQYGAALKMETQEEITNKHFKDYLEKNDISVIGAPAFTDLVENEDGSQVYTIRIETLPDFELKDYKSLEVYEPYHKVTDEEIENEINYTARRLGKREETDMVSDYEHIVTVDVYKLDSDTGKAIKDTPEAEGMTIDLMEDTPDIKEMFLNQKVGDEVIENRDAKFPNAEREKYIIKKIEKVIPCEINDEFAKIASKNRFDNLEDYKQNIGFDLQNDCDARARRLMEEQVLFKIIELHEDVEVPEILVEKIKSQTIKSEKERYLDFDENDETFKKNLDARAKKAVLLELVQDKIIKKEKIEIEDYDYDNYADNILSVYNNDDSKMSRDTILTYIKQDENIKRTLLHKKFLDFLLDFTKTNEIDFNEFMDKKLYKPFYNFNENEDKNNEVIDETIENENTLK